MRPHENSGTSMDNKNIDVVVFKGRCVVSLTAFVGKQMTAPSVGQEKVVVITGWGRFRCIGFVAGIVSFQLT